MDTKLCRKCGDIKPLDQFHRSNLAKDGLQGKCKECNSKRAIHQYYKNPEIVKQRAAARKAAIKAEVDAYKSQTGCFFCEEREAIVLDLHHIDPSVKDLSVSALISLGNRSRVWREIEKCVVVCSKCHRKMHHGVLSLPKSIGLNVAHCPSKGRTDTLPVNELYAGYLRSHPFYQSLCDTLRTVRSARFPV